MNNSTENNQPAGKGSARGLFASLADRIGGKPTHEKIASLLEDLKSQEESTWSSACSALIEIGPPAVPKIVEVLNDKTSKERGLAAEILLHIHDPSTGPAFVQALKDEDPKIRNIAAQGLSSHQYAPAVPALIEAMGMKEDLETSSEAAFYNVMNHLGGTAFYAKFSLEMIGAPAVPDLIAALENENENIRMGAAELLGKIKDVSSIPGLNGLLKDKSWGVRYCAAKVLAEMENASGVRVLLEAMESGDRKAWSEAVSALGKTKDALAVSGLIAELKKKCGRSENSPPLYGSAIAAQKKLEERLLDMRFEICGALCIIGLPAVPGLFEALNDGNSRIQEMAIKGLEKINDASIAPGLTSFIKEDRGGYATRLAITALANLNDAAAVPGLLHALNDRIPDLREIAAEGLARVLRGELAKNDAVNIPGWCLEILNDAASIPGLRPGLADKFPAIREVAVDWLANVLRKDNTPNIPALINLLGSENHGKALLAGEVLAKAGLPAVPALIRAVRDRASYPTSITINALAKIGGPAIPALINELKNKDHYVRDFAVQALGKIGQQAVPQIIAGLKTADDDARSDFIRALGAAGNSDAIPVLAEELGAKDVFVRREAARQLGKYGHSAIPALRVALKNEDNVTRHNAAQNLIDLDELGIEEIKNFMAENPASRFEFQKVIRGARNREFGSGRPVSPDRPIIIEDLKLKRTIAGLVKPSGSATPANAGTNRQGRPRPEPAFLRC